MTKSQGWYLISAVYVAASTQTASDLANLILAITKVAAAAIGLLEKE